MDKTIQLIIVLLIITNGLSAQKINPPIGRIAVVADGNSPDPDDLGATAVSLALLRATGLEDRLVHYSHSCDIVRVSRISERAEVERHAMMQSSCDITARRWGGFDDLTFYDAKWQLDETIKDLAKAINASTADDPLWIIEAGEPDIIWEAVNLAEASKREFIHIVTHHPANDRGDVYDLSDVMALGIPAVNLHNIPDQNKLLKKPLSDWYWARDHDDNGINWLWERGFVAQKSDMNYPAIVGFMDCSDAGMIYYWATIKSGGDFFCDVPKLKKLFLEYVGH